MNVTDCIGITYMHKKVYVVRKPVENVVTKFLVVEHHSRGDRMFSSSVLSYPYLEQEHSNVQVFIIVSVVRNINSQ